jgi:SRSO17 transposase
LTATTWRSKRRERPHHPEGGPHNYQELKQEVGLGHFEGRGWRGFHHHASLCIAAYGFLTSEQETIPPSEPHSSSHFQAPRLPEGYRSRGAAAQD